MIVTCEKCGKASTLTADVAACFKLTELVCPACKQAIASVPSSVVAPVAAPAADPNVLILTPEDEVLLKGMLIEGQKRADR
jgi:hypothetical protein